VIRFTHPLLSSILYRDLGDERRAVHGRLADVVDDPLLRARHLALSREEPDADVAALLDGGVRLATDRGAWEVAAELAEHALRLTPGSERHRGPQTGGDGLTPTEPRLAELVAEGRSNKEIAAALIVTPKTVGTTRSRLYAKLGVHSRTEVIRRLDERPARGGAWPLTLRRGCDGSLEVTGEDVGGCSSPKTRR
jgi:DNA-binding CsgD family transcriptional regulator